MVFTKREKVILAAAIAVLCALVLDVYALTPLLERRAAVRADLGRLQAKFAKAQGLLKRRRLLGRKWRRMLDEGMKDDPAAAESQLLRHLRNWSSDARIRLSSLRPERSAEKSRLPEITVHAAGTGSMYAVSRFLYAIETARIPAKVKMLQVGSRRDGTDDLSIHVRVSTLYAPAEDAPPEAKKPRLRRAGGS